MTQTTVTIRQFRHRGDDQIGLHFQYDKELISIARSIDGMRWSQSNLCWYIQNNPVNLKKIFTAFRGHAHIDKGNFFNGTVHSKSKPTAAIQKKRRPIKPIPEAYLNLLKRRRYSVHTIKSYQYHFSAFINHFDELQIDELDENHIRKYQDYLVNEKNVSISSQNQAINAIKFYFEHVLQGERKTYFIERPRKEYKLPDVLSKGEIGRMISGVVNLKHKCLLAVIYSCGLRRSEVINLRISDIDSARGMVKIIGAKGKKDRYVQLSRAILPMLRSYYRKYRPVTWLFEGQTGGQYSAGSILKVIKKAAGQAGIRKRVYPHILRHSPASPAGGYATHHLEQGVDIRYIQEWLGHSSIKTTEKYTHVSGELGNIKNPIDELL